MLEALWSVEFQSNVHGFGAGVAVIETGRILGGDGQFIYVGSYKVTNDTIHADLTITHYAGPMISVFGQAKQFGLSLSGQPAQNKFTMQGHVAGQPNLKIGIQLTRRAELP